MQGPGKDSGELMARTCVWSQCSNTVTEADTVSESRPSRIDRRGLAKSMLVEIALEHLNIAGKARKAGSPSTAESPYDNRGKPD